jgi:hypothetical protein
MLLRTCVARGSAWLDRYDQTWHQRVNVGTLANTNTMCVLGQLYGNSDEFLGARYCFSFDDEPESKIGKLLELPRLIVAFWFFLSHGFAPIRDPEVVWKRLWEAEVMKRQSKEKAALSWPDGSPLDVLLTDEDYAIMAMDREDWAWQ